MESDILSILNFPVYEHVNHSIYLAFCNFSQQRSMVFGVLILDLLLSIWFVNDLYVINDIAINCLLFLININMIVFVYWPYIQQHFYMIISNILFVVLKRFSMKVTMSLWLSFPSSFLSIIPFTWFIALLLQMLNRSECGYLHFQPQGKAISISSLSMLLATGCF